MDSANGQASPRRQLFKPTRPATATTSSNTPEDKLAALDTPARPSNGYARPPVVPLTTSNLSRYARSLANSAEGPAGREEHQMQGKSSTATNGLGISQVTGNGIAVGIGIGRPAGPPVKASVPATASPSMLSSKRYTRQMAPASPPRLQQDDEPSTIDNNGTSSASQVRARARLTSGSAPRKKPAVPGTERADRPAQSSARTPSIYARPASRQDHDRPPSTISRPGSSMSVSRPQSRMDHVPASSIISASALDPASYPLSHTLSQTLSHTLPVTPRPRRGSTSSVGTVVQRKQENVRVCVRVRPPTAAHQHSDALSEEAWISSPEDHTISLAAELGQTYRFDALVTGSGNAQIYDQAARELIHSSMNGFDAVVFAYGQTASGKTFTLSGTSANPGIIPQAVTDIFKYIRSHPQKEFLLRASYLEIYNEQLKDLLAPETAGQVKVRQDEKKRFFVSPLREEVVTNEAHVAQLLARGETNRHTGSTDYNARSSRSHTVFQIVIESRNIDEARDGVVSRPVTPSLTTSRFGTTTDDRAVVTSRLSLIDLAGSEKATSQADRRVEGAFINRSLLTLEKVIAALTEDRSRAHVPYRDSKLTQILQPSLSGEARIAVICTVNPSAAAIQESTSTLKFAQRVKKVTLNAERNEVVGDKALIYRYERTIAEMTAYIAQLEHTQGTSNGLPTDLGSKALPAPVGLRNLSNPEVLKAKEDRAKLQGFIVNAGNLDDARDAVPRPVTPMRPLTTAQLPLLQEQLLDSQDRVAELEEQCERQKDEIAALRIRLGTSGACDAVAEPTDSIMDALRKRNEELERQCREYRTILANEDQVTALKSERRLAAREWSDKLVQLQNSLDKSRALQQDALQQLADERKKTARLEKSLLKFDIQTGLLPAGDTSPHRGQRTSFAELDLLASEVPMLDTNGSYLQLDEMLDSPIATPVRRRR